MPADSLQQRLLTAIVAGVPLLAVLFLAPPHWGIVLLAALVLAGAWEWGGFFAGTTTVRRVGYVATIAVALLAAWFGATDWLMPVLWLNLAWWVYAFWWVLRFPVAIPGWLLLIGGLMVLVPGWLALAQLHLQAGPQWLVFVFIVIGAADTGAYFAGRRLGRTRLAPRVSPGKTWEGAIGGLVAVALVGVAGSAWFGEPVRFLLPLCVAVALASIVGDLTISMFKRNAGLKDSGSLFPGHGGVLDRIDSIAGGAPLLAIGLGWAGHIA